MAGKISEMTAGTAPSGTELIEVTQDGNTRRLTVAQLSPATLAALEAKIGATLVEDADARMSDARAPTAHALNAHTAITFAQLVALVSGAVLARTDAAQVYSGGQHSDVETLTDGATIAVDADGDNAKKVTLGGNREVSNPTNCAEGKSWTVRVIQDGTGLRALTFAANYVFPDGTPDTSADTAAQERIFSFHAVSATRIVVLYTGAY